MAEFKILRNYMVDIYINEDIDDRFISLIPQQRIRINELMQLGVILTYSLSLDRSRLWITMFGENEESVMKTLQTFPMMEYFSPEIYELAFHNNISYRMPELSLN